MNPYIYLRALKHAEHTVFCVEAGQKTYYDPLFNRTVAYSSGQQVKRSILQELADIMGFLMAPLTFNYNIKQGALEPKEIWSPCNPNYVDQLLGGWMRAKNAKGESKKTGKISVKTDENRILKRRSPLSISSMTPLHPLLAAVEDEAISFDRNGRLGGQSIRVRMGNRELSEQEIEDFLEDNDRTLPPFYFKGQKRTTGLFVFDVAIDLRTLFCVSTNQHEPEISKEMIASLKENGWIESENVFGECLVLPKNERDRIIPALAKSLINWRITSNQARTFSLMETLAIAISSNANTLPGAIRAKLVDDGEKPKAKPVIDETAGADIFVTLPCAGYIATEIESADALSRAENKLIEMMSEFDYEHQI